MRIISFEIVAPSLDYRQGVFTAEHQIPGAYPVTVHSGFLREPAGTIRHFPGGAKQLCSGTEPETHSCVNQAELIQTLEIITGSTRLRTLIESLIAQINEANPDG